NRRLPSVSRRYCSSVHVPCKGSRSAIVSLSSATIRRLVVRTSTAMVVAPVCISILLQVLVQYIRRPGCATSSLGCELLYVTYCLSVRNILCVQLPPPGGFALYLTLCHSHPKPAYLRVDDRFRQLLHVPAGRISHFVSRHFVDHPARG